MTTTTSIVTKAAANLAVGAVLGLAALFGSTETVSVDTTPAVPTPAEVTASVHGCWTGEAPADMRGQWPGHVVLGDGTYAGRRMVTEAIDQVLGGHDHGLEVYAFCR